MTDYEIRKVLVYLLRRYPPGDGKVIIDSGEVAIWVGLPESKVEEVLAYLARIAPGSITTAN